MISAQDLAQRFEKVQSFLENIWGKDFKAKTDIDIKACLAACKSGVVSDEAKAGLNQQYTQILQSWEKYSVISYVRAIGSGPLLDDLLTMYPDTVTNALIEACERGDAEAIKMCLQENHRQPIDFNQTDHSNRHPIDILYETYPKLYQSEVDMLIAAGSPPPLLATDAAAQAAEPNLRTRAQRFVSRMIDISNRQLFEGLLDFFVSPLRVLELYYDVIGNHRDNVCSYYLFHEKEALGKLALVYYLILRPLPAAFVWACLGFALRMLLLPITATIYVVSRLALVVFNPTASAHNANKAWWMRTASILGVSALAIISVIALTAPVFNENVFEYASSGFGLPSNMVPIIPVMMGSFMLGTIFMTGFACLFYAAKKVAQNKNTEILFVSADGAKEGVKAEHIYPSATAPKHHYHPVEVAKDFENAHRYALSSYHLYVKNSGTRTREDGHTRKLALAGEMPNRAHLKAVLARFQQVAGEHVAGTLTQATYASLYQLTKDCSHVAPIPDSYWDDYVTKPLAKATVDKGKLVARAN